MSTKKRIVFSALIIFVLLIQFISAQTQTSSEIQELKIRINTTAVNELISVKSNFDQTALIPNYEYAANLNITWAIPEKALVGVTAPKVLIFVTVKINEKFVSFYFKESGVSTRSASFTLTCTISANKCANESNLTRNIPFFVKLENTTTKVQDEDVFVIQASLTPFGQYETLLNETRILSTQIDTLKDSLNTLNVSDPRVEPLINKLDSLKNQLSSYSVENVSNELKNVSDTIDSIKAQQTTAGKIEYLEEQIKNKTGLNTSLSLEIDPQIRQIIQNKTEQALIDAKNAIDSAKNATANFDISAANKYIALAEEKLQLLSKIAEIEKEKAKKEQEGQLYSIAVGIAIILILAIIVLRIRERERKGIGAFSFMIITLQFTGLRILLGEGAYLIFTVVGILLISFLLAIIAKRKRIDEINNQNKRRIKIKNRKK